MPTLGENIRRERERRKISRRELARRLGLKEGSSAIADLEMDRHEPKFGRVVQVAKSLSVSVETLTAGTDPEYDDLPLHTTGVDSPRTEGKESPPHDSTREIQLRNDALAFIESESARLDALVERIEEAARLARAGEPLPATLRRGASSGGTDRGKARKTARGPRR